ncbi:MAG: type II secretion system F family protein [Actinobacteria bacterium]|nr:type II secretion system F family protein [Actinomycetota bacterium]
MLLALAALLLAGAVYLAGEVITYPARERHQALRRASTYGMRRFQAASPERLRFSERVLAPAAGRLARIALRINPRVTVETVRLRLLTAGMSRKLTPTAFLAAKAAFGGVGALFGLPIGAGFGPLGAIALAAVLAVGGFMLPGVWISGKAKRRREEIRSELPDALDLLAVSVEAGLGFDGAVAKLTEHMEGSLAEEFSLTLGEMRIGESRQDALKKFAERVETPEVGTFTRAIIQADQLGISLGRILRLQANDTRLKRQAAAEEKAMKAPIKMLFPTVLFIFPAMFLVILGPALIAIKEVL